MKILNNKLIMGSAVLVIIFLAVFIAKGFSPKEINPELNEEVVTETEDLLPGGEVGSPEAIKGSCDLIAQGSTCVEYYGSYWTEETIKLVCEEGVYSTEGCPGSNSGGCRMLPGSETDMITWHYDRGGDPFSQETIQYAMQACNSVPGGTWAEED